MHLLRNFTFQFAFSGLKFLNSNPDWEGKKQSAKSMDSYGLFSSLIDF